MNQEKLKQYIENNRDCDVALLDKAVSKGLQRAKSERIEAARFIQFASTCAAAAALCFILDLEPVKVVVSELKPGSGLISEGNAEILHGYVNGVIHNLFNFLGGN